MVRGVQDFGRSLECQASRARKDPCGRLSVEVDEEMNAETVIPTNFRVPAGCRHEFVLFFGNKPSAVIFGVPGKRQIRFQTLGSKPENQSLVMDWMAESVEHLRFVCE